VPLQTDAAGCPCLPTPTDPAKKKMTAVTGKPQYPATLPAYGWGCKAHDDGYDVCDPKHNPAPKTGAGEKDDWCKSKWCYVDPNNCDHFTRETTYTAEKDYFSYEACDANFKGNGWVGRCKNCALPYVNSFCTCGGLEGCKCLAGATKQQQATGKPKYAAEVPAYGSGCKAHDKGYDTCKTSKNTAAGKADDWCEDKWCFVDPNTCKFKTLKVSYTKNPNDYFSYETCDDKFAGNGWVGRCKCAAPNSNTYCACPKTTTKKDSPVSSAQKITSIVPQVIVALAAVIAA